jgi:hypothetical protein
MNKNTFKSIGAVLAGFITVFVLSLVTDFILQKLDVFPGFKEPSLYTWRMLMLALISRSIYTVAGGYVTAILATNRPMRHAVILGIIGIVAGLLGTIAMWDKGSHWYPILLIVLALPCTWLGGKLKIYNQ